MNCDELKTYIQQHPRVWHDWLYRCRQFGRALLLESDLRGLWLGMGSDLRPGERALGTWINLLQEAVVLDGACHFAARHGVAAWQHYYAHVEHLEVDVESVGEFLAVKEALVGQTKDAVLEVDFAPFNRGFPRMTEVRSIGQGVLFLNRQLAGRLIARPEILEQKLLRFLSVHALEGKPLLVYGGFADAAALRRALQQASARLEALEEQAPWEVCAPLFHPLGLAPGWGDTAGRCLDTLGLLLDVLEAPSAEALEAFLARIPMISRLLILSPHGYFGQENVLGRPDTGGQVVYILDQVRALEKEMRERLQSQGVDVCPKIVVATRLIPEADGTRCDQALEKIWGTGNSYILRVPFRSANGDIVPQWISRFEIWPYLESYAAEVKREATANLGGLPDLIVGNYSDGNLVASLLSRELKVTQCNIAHALEKTKYLYSDLYWKDMDERYHFACQYTADLISMNSADFIITSTYQEIAGTREVIGQYESYGAYSLPGLYRVTHGIDVYDPKFNIVSPGADAEVYFPYGEASRRLPHLQEEIKHLLEDEISAHPLRGGPLDMGRPIIFTLARLDRIKNLAGLAEWYGSHPRLREQAQLLIVGGHIDAARSSDAEEQGEIGRMHEIFDRHGLDRCARWIGGRLDKHLTGELYRTIADGRGVFVQPALFEAFGLTVIEAMASGLPVFATRYGGPLEIIRPGESGFHIDPNDGVSSAAQISEFLQRCEHDPGVWQAISQGAIARVRSRYTWQRYAERMMTLARIYGFWKFVNNLEREETQRYLDMFYHLLYRPLAQAVPAP